MTTSTEYGYCSCPPVADGLVTFARDCGMALHRQAAALAAERRASEEVTYTALAAENRLMREELRHVRGLLECSQLALGHALGARTKTHLHDGTRADKAIRPRGAA